MNKIKTLTAAFLIISITAFSQSAKRLSNNHTQILKLGVNTYFETDEFPYSISWEKKVGNKESVQIGFLPRIRSSNNEKTTGVGFNFGYRKYISKNRSGISGLFISPTVKFGFVKDKYEYSSYYYTGNPPQTVVYTYQRSSDITQFSGGFVFGHNWVFKSGFAFEVSAGMAYFNSNDKSNNTNNSQTYNNTYKESGIMPQAQLSFGYAF